ncbi:TIGR02611 family protein [Mycobacterium kyorinense]|uniref:TIGR02611 family protein n=1 Tax=Mycobacterium kyorinense TaxID=487514 RepID=A0A1A2Z5B2_9MYCO|nr:TIGR02611 family protein [Mycobacterium kyorinense]OBI44361.1 TIGR02611 family protein [Mycobacterium kyorinense]
MTPSGRPITHRWTRWRDRLRHWPVVDLGYRMVVAVIGLTVLTIGVIAIPYPGPGWAIVFLGLAVLASEFAWAHRLLTYARSRYDAAMAWFTRKSRWVQALGVAFTAAVVVMTMWLLGVVHWSAGLVGVEQSWLTSPI